MGSERCALRSENLIGTLRNHLTVNKILEGTEARMVVAELAPKLPTSYFPHIAPQLP